MNTTISNCLNCEMDGKQCYECYILSGQEDKDIKEFNTLKQIKNYCDITLLAITHEKFNLMGISSDYAEGMKHILEEILDNYFGEI